MTTLPTIWTMPACTVPEKLRRTRTWFWIKVAVILPKELAFWSLVRSGTLATRRNEATPDLSYMTVLERTPGPR